MADFGLTEANAVIQETVSTLIQDALIESSKLMDKVQNFAAAPGEDLFDKDATQLALDKYKAIQVRVEDIASLQAKPNIVADMVDRMARQIALQIDTDLVTVLEDTSAAAPDHRLAFDNATSLGKTDILIARELLQEQNLDFSECWIGVNPGHEREMLAIAEFVEADKYGSSAGLVNGELGKIYGARVVMSNQFNDNKVIVWHPSHCAFARQQAPRFEQDRDLPNLATLYSVNQIYGVKQLDSGKRAVMLGTAA